MALVAGNLRTVLLSTHLPLAQAVRLVERDRLVARNTSGSSRIATLGHRTSTHRGGALNPHGAEGGCLALKKRRR